MNKTITHRTGITTRYNRSWVPDIRELLQNAFDGLKGHFGRNLEMHPVVQEHPHLFVELFSQKSCNADSRLFSLEVTKQKIVMLQRMPPNTGLPRSALMFHSTKTFDEGSLGGFGEGLKICALFLLSKNYTLKYEMYDEEWVFRLESSDMINTKDKELVIDITSKPVAVWSQPSSVLPYPSRVFQ